MALLRKDRIWPTAIATVLLGNVVLGLVLMRVAGSDEHFAVEPDYYRKAVAWDSTMVSAERSAALGWSLVTQITPVRPGSPSRFAVTVHDSLGAAVTGASVRVDAFPVAYAAEVQHAPLSFDPEGEEYATTLDLSRSGLWEMRVAVGRGSEQFSAVIRMQLSDDGHATLVAARPGDPMP